MWSVRRAGNRCVTLRPTLALSEETAAAILSESAARLPNETGGILVGCAGAQAIEVVVAVGPGPRATHRRAYFRRDGDYAQGELDQIYVASNRRHDYLGEWHSHPLPVGPSGRDRHSMEWIARNPDYDCPEPLLVLSQRGREGEWGLAAFQWTAGQLVRIPLAIAS